jgi:hypothetical protein
MKFLNHNAHAITNAANPNSNPNNTLRIFVGLYHPPSINSHATISAGMKNPVTYFSNTIKINKLPDKTCAYLFSDNNNPMTNIDNITPTTYAQIEYVVNFTNLSLGTGLVYEADKWYTFVFY